MIDPIPVPRMKLPDYVNLGHHAKRAASAHQAVHEGIADHAEKEKARREEKNHAAQLNPDLKQVDYDAG